ncbi:hypothetical protein BA088_20325, partial [Salmonella enterica]|nr:hypothetical protein [Salmonella enterica]
MSRCFCDTAFPSFYFCNSPSCLSLSILRTGDIKIASPYLRYKVNIMKKSFLGAVLSLGLLSA